MALSSEQRKRLRAAAHHLNPVAIVGQNGLNEAVLNEIDRNLEVHELIKVRLRVEEREDFEAMINPIIEHTGAELVQIIGRLAILYREKDEDLAPTAN